MEASNSNDSGFSPVEKRSADGGNEGRTDQLSSFAGCLLVCLLGLCVIAVAIFVVRLSGL
jgi:hypothetical protein